ncbi:MAG: thioredoxin family protein [Alistipes sp.]|nr:thioredoxin family protein [Alistipes sp.]
MRFFRLTLLALNLFLLGFAALAQETVKWSTSVEYGTDGTAKVLFTADIAPGWHMYDTRPYEMGPNHTEFEYTGTQGLEIDGKVREVTKSVRKYDEIFDMEIGYFEGRAVFEQRVRLTADNAVLRGEVSWMVCNDDTCLPPDDHEFEVLLTRPALQNGTTDIPATNVATDPKNENGESAEAALTDEVDTEPELEAHTYGEIIIEDNGPAESVRAAKDPLGGSLWSVILAAMKWALLAIFTPCVFPMIPMTVSFFMKDGQSRAVGRFRATMYGIFIVAIYTIPIAAIILITRVVGGDTVTSDIFNWLSTHWLPNVLFFLIFMFFAASFFGAFELTLPSWMVTKTDSKSECGGVGGIFFMALTLVLVSFSCTVPIVGSALTEATSGGNWLRPIIAILTYSIIFALPFTFFAFFPSLLEKLPRSGGWLNSVKVVLGFVEVALGLKFLSIADQTYHWGLLDREIYLAIWIVVFSLMGFYLLGKIKFRHDSDLKYIGVGRLMLVIATFTFVVYMIPGLFGAPLKGLSGYLPPMHTQDFIAGGTAAPAQDKLDIDNDAPLYSDFLHLPHGLQGFFDLDEAQAYADKVGKPLFVDLTGHGCVNCREMEARVWSDPRVLELLRDEFVIVALYVDDKKTLPEERWVTTDKGRVLKGLGKINAYKALQLYGTNAQPIYIIQGRGGEILAGPRGYDLSIDGFISFLKGGIEKYRAGGSLPADAEKVVLW